MSWAEASYTIDEITKKINSQKATGIPPNSMASFSLREDKQGYTEIKIVVPKDIYLDDQLLCTTKGLRIVRTAGVKPTGPYDGVLIKDIPFGVSTTFVDRDKNLEEGVEYFYGFYPYSDHGVFNLDPKNILSKTQASTVGYWAFDQNFLDLNPETSITYPEGFLNSNFEPMMTNKDIGAPTFGGWQYFLDDVLKNKPYMVNYKSGEAVYELDPMDYTKKTDGNPSEYNLNGTGKGCFSWLSTIWMKEEYAEDGNSRRVIFTNDENAEGFTPLGFWDKDKKILKGLWLPMCPINTSGETIFDKPVNTGNLLDTAGSMYSITENIDRSVVLGGYTLVFLRDLLTLLFKTTNIFSKSGMRNIKGGSNNNDGKSFLNEYRLPGWFGTGTINDAYGRLLFHSEAIASGACYLLDPYIAFSNNAALCIDTYRKRQLNLRVNDVAASFNNNSDCYVDSYFKSLKGINVKSYSENRNQQIENCGSLLTVKSNDATSNTGVCSYYSYGGSPGAAYVNVLFNRNVSNPLSVLYLTADVNANYNDASGLACVLLPKVDYEP